MAFTVTAVQKDNKEDTIEITIDGSYDGTLTAITLDIVSPDGDPYQSAFFPGVILTNPVVFPSSYDVTASDFSIPSEKFIDGAWSITATFDYSDAPQQITPLEHFLFNNNLKNEYIDLLEETVPLGIISNENTKKIRGDVREALQASETFFSLSRYTDVKRVLDAGSDIIKGRI